MQLLRAADESHGGEAETVFAQSLVRRLDDGGVIGEAQIIVRAKINDFAARDLDGRALRRLNLAFFLVQSLVFQARDFRAQMFDHPGIGHGWTPLKRGGGIVVR